MPCENLGRRIPGFRLAFVWMPAGAFLDSFWVATGFVLCSKIP
jgi:hypothetical protein